MEKRAKRARRLLDVMNQLHKIEEQKKQELQRRYDALQRSQHEVIHALNTDDALHGLFVDTTARFLRSLAQEAQQVSEAKESRTKRLFDQAVKVKSAERLTDALEQHTDRMRKENELHDIIEHYVGRKSASLPQV